jgi:hypothetical protein
LRSGPAERGLLVHGTARLGARGLRLVAAMKNVFDRRKDTSVNDGHEVQPEAATDCRLDGADGPARLHG